ncbi:hypothetical protein [Deinococcus aquaedulcis]|uniref:hypothetical protein n=1 Tax=Deinococcus aquaedulcis TaxID=2840455 RepID=UPI002E2BDB11|nr:hypothetical protein [Deinococcus aquaedulcis]
MTGSEVQGDGVQLGDLQVEAVAPQALTPALAALYDTGPEDVAWMAETCEAAWLVSEVQLVTGQAREVVVGAAGARPSPAHGAELLGGVFAGPRRAEVTGLLASAARQALGRVYAFADGSLFAPELLLQAGWREAGAYRRLEGRVPYRVAAPPPGVELVSLADAAPQARLQALQSFEDRIGHHAVTPEAAQAGAGGFDPALSVVALDAEGQGIGVCRAALEDVDGARVARLDAPGVQPLWRHTPLRAALLAEVCARLRAQGATHLSMDSWGDTPEELAHDLGWGLHVTDETPILASAEGAPGEGGAVASGA